MASHANAAKLCKSCGKPSPKGARLNRKGLCVKCRNDDDKGAKAAKRATPTQAAPEPPVGPLVCRVPTPAEQEAFAKEFPQFAAPVGSTRPKLRAVDRQLVAPAIVQADVNALRSANANLAAMVEHLKWAIASFVNGHLTKEELARKARIAGPASETEPQAVAS